MRGRGQKFPSGVPEGRSFSATRGDPRAFPRIPLPIPVLGDSDRECSRARLARHLELVHSQSHRVACGAVGRNLRGVQSRRLRVVACVGKALLSIAPQRTLSRKLHPQPVHAELDLGSPAPSHECSLSVSGEMDFSWRDRTSNRGDHEPPSTGAMKEPTPTSGSTARIATSRAAPRKRGPSCEPCGLPLRRCQAEPRRTDGGIEATRAVGRHSRARPGRRAAEPPVARLGEGGPSGRNNAVHRAACAP